LLKRLLRSIFALLTGQFLNVIGNLLLVPLFLSRWSSGVYGDWMALSAVVAYFGVTDLGVNSAAGNTMMAAYARGDGLLCRNGSYPICTGWSSLHPLPNTRMDRHPEYPTSCCCLGYMVTGLPATLADAGSSTGQHIPDDGKSRGNPVVWKPPIDRAAGSYG